MPKYVADSFSISGLKISEIRLNNVRQITVPITLNERWINEARLAFLLAPKDESIAVTQVPMFCPIMIGIAAD